MLSILPSIIVLGLAALAAWTLAVRRRPLIERAAEREAAGRALALAVGCQSVHFVEETVTGFHERLGDVLGIPGMPFWGFVAFNAVWIGIWIASITGLRSMRSGAFFAAWFLAIAGMVNGIAHPLLAIISGQYFPGLLSSPFVAIACLVLWHRLRTATRGRVRLDTTT